MWFYLLAVILFPAALAILSYAMESWQQTDPPEAETEEQDFETRLAA